MESPEKKLLRLLVERDPASPEFWRRVRTAFRPAELPDNKNQADELGMWKDVFVQQKLPWRRFLQSALLHGVAVALIWTISISWIRQQKIQERASFDRSSLVTYTPQEYLPPLNTGVTKAQKAQKGDPVYAKQPILSVPREADNRSQTIVAPPDIKLNHDVAMPNIIAAGAISPTVPMDATRPSLSRITAPDAQVVAPAPDVQFSPNRVVQAAIKSDVIAPPPEVSAHHRRGLTGPDAAVVAPPPDLTQSTKGRAGVMNVGPSAVVAPAPQLTLAEQHAAAGRGSGKGHLPGGGVQPVAPPPSLASGNAGSGGRLVALGIHPIAPTGPVNPGGNRRGTFAASPHGKTGASGTPDLTGSKSDDAGSSGHTNGSLPAGLQVGAPGSKGDTSEMASLSTSGARPGARAATAVSDDKITDMDRKVFGGKRVYGRTLNMPNLNSSTGSWVIKFAELDGGKDSAKKEGELLEPVAMEKSDPGYPLELIRANVHGMVTLYAVIHADGKVGDIRVLYSPDDRLDAYAAKALARWKFLPAERAGKPVALEAVVEIPFKVRRSF